MYICYISICLSLSVSLSLSIYIYIYIYIYILKSSGDGREPEPSCGHMYCAWPQWGLQLHYTVLVALLVYIMSLHY